ncbi:MAG TPA: glycosyltransferase [Candidatus Dormibacteraeota bacterium]
MAPLVTPLADAQLGGAQAFAADLARALQDRGCEVRLYCAEGSVVEGVDLRLVPTGDLSAALVRPTGHPEPLPGLRAAFRRCFEMLAEDGADAVSQHGFDAEAIEEAARLPVPVLHTLHLPPISPAVVAAARASRDRFATVSHAAGRLWREVGVEVTVILNGVPVFDPPAAEVEGWALVPGRVSPEKGVHIAIRAARAAGLEPLVVGAVYDVEYARAHGIQPRHLPRTELWALMARCAVTLMPVDWEEPFGLVAAESQVAGTPVVAFARGGLPEVIDGGGGVLLAPGDERAFVEAIGAARALDRGVVRASAVARLDIRRAAAEYEQLLCD